MDASLGLSVVPVQYLEDGLEIGWSAVEAADAYELSVVTDNDYFTLHRTIPASGETQYRVHLDRSELAGHGPYMATVNATAQGEVTQRSRDVFVTMQVARELDDALRASSQELSPYLQMTSAFMMVGAYQEDEVRTYLTNLGFEKIETCWLTSIQSKSMEHLICTPYKNGCQSNNQQPFYYATNLNCRIGGISFHAPAIEKPCGASLYGKEKR